MRTEPFFHSRGFQSRGNIHSVDEEYRRVLGNTGGPGLHYENPRVFDNSGLKMTTEDSIGLQCVAEIKVEGGAVRNNYFAVLDRFRSFLRDCGPRLNEVRRGIVFLDKN